MARFTIETDSFILEIEADSLQDALDLTLKSTGESGTNKQEFIASYQTIGIISQTKK